MSELTEFRQQVRTWLEANCPMSLRTPTPDGELIWGGSEVNFTFDDQRQWFNSMRDKHWFCPSWPTQYGGGGLTAQQNSVLESEMRRLKCRPPQINLGIWMLGPVLLEHGTELQKQQFLTPMTRGEVRWCQGFSEPNAGSDLASIRTSAIDQGDHYLVNGSKIWTSYGDKSDWMYALVRTDAKAPKHQGISLLLLDMHSQGVQAKPIDLISGKSSFCEVFFDNVVVPKENLIGELNGGWKLAKELLQHERSAMSKFGEFQLPTHFDLMSLMSDYMPAPHSASEAALLNKAVAANMEEQAYNLTVQRLGAEMQAGQSCFGLMSIMKLVHTEQEKIKFELLLDAMGYRGLGWEDDSFSEQEQAVTRAWLNSFSQTIAGGSSEVQLNVIAKRVLQLPENKGVS
ncbi:acyl-CoA dehydrogenase family protein [Pseudoalteromonas sp. SCQQ13]|uniref:acyl-CoA dehydrogenase family protein n=1 Tax=Pseudoalteromonas sp. SCQQ13 TaxID=2792066 RepID=UPI0018CE6E2E|nr:acyl-CoA dehydrogenase family protein [Pseudoalteromonas sp. SCQQ13]MBH0092006.1 acyl-CoA dehydrogenase family protein [Pseudoalteromonas sp. SCQQ13]